jgi:hypothetical protein
MAPPSRALQIALGAALAGSCVPEDGEGAGGTTGGSTGGTGSSGGESGSSGAVLEDLSPRTGPEAHVLEDMSVETSSPTAPGLGRRVARRTAVVLAEPRWGAPLRGRIDMGHPFAVHARAAGKGCTGEGWARVDAQGYVCLRDAEPTRRRGQALPALPEGRVVPFLYAKARADRAGELLAPVPRYRSAAALAAGEAPLDWLRPHHEYAFVESRRVDGATVVLDRSRRAVRADALQFERPSEFAGRDLGERPVAAGAVAAWAAEAPVSVRAGPGLDAEVVGRVEYHREVDLEPAPVRRDGVDWYALRGGAGWVSDEDVRRWAPTAALADVGDDEPWIDVELGEQTLALYRGRAPVFVTLISSGAGDNPTPRGVFRIWHKQALGDMRSLPGADDSYAVEEVPWVQYFHRRFALHAAFWHNKFGRRRSHGCVNLSPRDAAYVFGRTQPALPEGWTFVYEHEEARGTSVRIRKGDAPVPDRRAAVGEADDVGGDDVEPGEEGG